MNQTALIKSARESLAALLTKSAFTPMDPAAGGAPPMDPAMAAGGGAPPPMDPAAAGAPPPMDPAAAGAGAPPPAGDPAAMGGQPVMLTMNDLMQFAQMLQGGGGAAPAPGGAPAAPGAPGAPNEGAKPKGGKNNTAAVEEKIDRLTSAVMELIAFMTGAQTAMEPEGAEQAPPDVGMQAPPAMGQGVPDAAMPPPEVAGSPAAPGAPPAGMEVQASYGSRAKMLSSIITNLRKS